jgi:hypothetical protein
MHTYTHTYNTDIWQMAYQEPLFVFGGRGIEKCRSINIFISIFS